MRYLMLLCDEEAKQIKPGDPGFDELMGEYAAFGELVRKLGVLQDGGRLQPISAATTVRVRDGQTTCSDGPYAETKEQFGGYYVLECKDLDQALELAAKIPTAKNGSVEVRPLMG